MDKEIASDFQLINLKTKAGYGMKSHLPEESHYYEQEFNYFSDFR